MSRSTAFAFEEYAVRSINYLESMVDGDGLPYFNIFWGDAAEAAHDWPDFGDVMARQTEGAVMLRRMTGRTVATERPWLSKLMAQIDPSDGQLRRPQRPWCKSIVEDVALPLGALNAAAIDGDSAARKAAAAMAEGYLRRLRDGDLRDKPAHAFSGFAVKSLMVAARMLGSQAAFDVAGTIVQRFIAGGRAFTPDNTYGPRTHAHGILKSLVGAADYALTAGDPVLYSRIDALYRHTRTLGTRFGFVPEVINWRTSDMIACETCTLMDYAGLGVTLANHGHPEYWGDMERLARNHLAESQIRDVSWLPQDSSRPDTDQFTWRNIRQRIVGAWAGWSAPNHVLAYRETLNGIWGGPELRDRIRLLQNCCGGSGVHALFILWKNAARFTDGVLWVNMHLDKLLPEAEIRCQQPYRGILRIKVAKPCGAMVRIPEFARAADLRASINGVECPIDIITVQGGSLLGQSQVTAGAGARARAFGSYTEFTSLQAGDTVELRYPLPVAAEELAVGNPGHRAWRYRATWKGDTVVGIEPVGNEVRTCWSDFDKMDREVFYGKEGPGPLYQRAHMLADAPPAEADLWMDDKALDLWAGIAPGRRAAGG